MTTKPTIHTVFYDSELFEAANGDWVLDYRGPGGDYRVIFAGPDAELRAQAYAEQYVYPKERAEGEVDLTIETEGHISEMQLTAFERDWLLKHELIEACDCAPECVMHYNRPEITEADIRQALHKWQTLVTEAERRGK